MKKLCLIVLIVISTIFAVWGTKKEKATNITTTATTQNNSNYDIVKATYEDKGININYPQIEKMLDSNKQKKINEIIRNEALNVINDYKEDIDNLDLKLDYEISFKGSDIISIKYLGDAYVKGAAHPTNIIRTTNINIDNISSLKLSDVVKINDSFVKKFKGGKYKAWSTNLNLETAGELKNIVGSLDNQALIEQFKEKTAKFYFTKDSLGVSVEIPHAVGDHMDFEIGNGNLDSLLLIKPAGSEKE